MVQLRKNKEGCKVISIIIPTYNSEKYLKRTLDSVFSQRFSDLEVIVVDSCSVDSTQSIVESYSKKYPQKIRCQLMAKEGQVKAINYGMSLAKGDILAFINSDDVYDGIGCFRLAEQCIGKKGAAWCYGQGKVINADGEYSRSLVTKFKSLWWEGNSSRVLSWFDYIVQPTVFFNRELWEKVGVFNSDYPLCFDYDFLLRASQVCKPIYIPFHIASWRAHSDSISVRNVNAQINESLRINRQYAKSFTDRFIQESIAIAEKIVYRIIG